MVEVYKPRLQCACRSTDHTHSKAVSLNVVSIFVACPDCSMMRFHIGDDVILQGNIILA